MAFYGIKLGKSGVTSFSDVKISLWFTISCRKKNQWTIAWKLYIVLSLSETRYITCFALEVPSWKSASKV